METRQRWQALQSRIGEARTALSAGDRVRALHAVDAALAIDPEYLVAQSMRAQILGTEPEGAVRGAANSPGPAVPWPEPSGVAPRASTREAGRVVADGYAEIEERAKRRRVARRMAAAREALVSSRFQEAAAAVDEVRQLDPDSPDLASLIAELRAAERRTPPLPPRPSRGGLPYAASALVLIGLAVASSWALQLGPLGQLSMRSLETSASDPLDGVEGAAASDRAGRPPFVRPVPEAGAPAAAASDPQPEMAAVSAAPAASETATGARAPEPREPLPDVDRAPAGGPLPSGERSASTVRGASPPPAAEPPLPSPAPPPRVMTAAAEPPLVTAPAVPRPVTDAPATSAVAESPTQPPSLSSTTAATTLPTPVLRSPAVRSSPPADSISTPVIPAERPFDDGQLVRQVLQRYRSAYEELDAESARAVWPGVNERALARAFDDLESQTLTFDACDVQLDGVAAQALCHGTTRYVPKIGSREPRVEPRTWSFSLKKQGSGWMIENARAGR